jgi:TPR repeat protein
LADGADPNEVDNLEIKGWTPLMAAAKAGSADEVDALLKANANVNTTNEYGATALDIAVLNGKMALAALIEAAGGKRRGQINSPPMLPDFTAGTKALRSGEYSTAFKNFRPLADEGDIRAQLSLGLMYEQGLGVQQDYTEAVRLLRLAADKGSMAAQLNLGLIYADGHGVPRDDDEAAQVYRLAAERQNARAQLHLGRAYADGRGVPQNYVQAYKWLSVACASADARISADAATLRGHVADKITPEQIAEAKGDALRFLPTAGPTCAPQQLEIRDNLSPGNETSATKLLINRVPSVTLPSQPTYALELSASGTGIKSGCTYSQDDPHFAPGKLILTVRYTRVIANKTDFYVEWSHDKKVVSYFPRHRATRSNDAWSRAYDNERVYPGINRIALFVDDQKVAVANFEFNIGPNPACFLP